MNSAIDGPVEVDETPKKKITKIYSGCVKFFHSICKFRKPNDYHDNADNWKPKSFGWLN